MKTRRRRKKAELARDRRLIGKWYMMGQSQMEIAEKIGVNQSTISDDLKVLHAEWLESALVDLDVRKSQELAKIDTLEQEYWDAWIRSQENEVTLRDETGKENKFTTITKGQVGNSQYLAGVQWCIDKRCKILGIEAASKIEHRIVDVTQLTNDELYAITKG